MKVNDRTIEKDFQVCMNMYNSSKRVSKKHHDLALSSPLRELKLIKKIGNHYKLRQISKPEITSPLIAFCILDYLELNGFQNFTPFSDLLNGVKSPGRIFRLSEDMLLYYLSELKRFTSSYDFDSTAGMQQLIKNSESDIDKIKIIKKIYG